MKALLARRLTRSPSPTVDLYFLNACADLVGPDGPVRRTAPTVFETERARLVIRHDAGAPPAPGKATVYFVDDAIFAGLSDTTLPRSHRLKLWAADCEAARRLAPGARTVAASTPEVLEDLRAALPAAAGPFRVLDPFWSEPYPDLAHFEADGPPRLAFLGAGTHRAGVAFFVRVLAALGERTGPAEIHVSANHRAALSGGPPGLRFVEATRWPEYRARLAHDRRHVALYPVPDTPHGRARSANKLIEHALVGAAPIYSDCWPRGRIAAEAGAGLALPPDPRLWAETARALLDDRARARALAEGAQHLARRLQDRDAQRALWTELLEIGR